MKKHEFKLLYPLVLLIISMEVHSASFDCQKAKSVTERLICQDNELSKLDDELAVIYKNSISKSKTPKDLISNQRTAWKQREEECASKSCLLDWFAQRKTFFGAETTTNIEAEKQNRTEQPIKNQ